MKLLAGKSLHAICMKINPSLAMMIWANCLRHKCGKVAFDLAWGDLILTLAHGCSIQCGWQSCGHTIAMRITVFQRST
jgi:hypothetical protein